MHGTAQAPQHDDRGHLTQGGVLRRRLVTAQVERPVEVLSAAAPRTPERLTAAAVSRAADLVHQLPLYFDRVESSQATLAEIAECLPDHALLSLIEGPGDAIGVVAISSELLVSLIEMQATGRVSSRAVQPRRPTATDAAVCADFVDACLTELAHELPRMAGHEMVAGYRYTSFLGDPRPLDLLLEDVVYRRLHLALRAGAAGQRDGTLTILMPQTATRPALADLSGAVGTTGGDDPRAPADTTDADNPPCGHADADLRPAVDAAALTLRAILARPKLSLGELKALVPGQMLSLPRSCLEAATLETGLGQVVAVGKVGESAGCHALRLRSGVLPAQGREADRAFQATFHPANPDPAEVDPAAQLPGSELDLPDDPFREAAKAGLTGAAAI